MADPDRTNADGERVSDIVARLRRHALNISNASWPPSSMVAATEAADIIEAQSKALALAASMWQPISTAPHDGSHIQVRDITQPSMPPFTAHWFDGAFHLSVNFDGEHSSHGCGSLTHWRPLEPAPFNIKTRGA